MFDDHRDLSLNRLLEVPDSKNAQLKSDVIRDRLERDRAQTFFDQAYLEQVRHQIIQQRMALDDSEPSEDVSHIVPLDGPRGFWGSVLGLMGWRQYMDLGEGVGIPSEAVEEIDLKEGDEDHQLSEIRDAINLQMRHRGDESSKPTPSRPRPQRMQIGRAISRIRRYYRQASYVIGLDIGSDALKYCLVRPQGERMVLESYGLRSMSPVDDEATDARLERVGRNIQILLSEEELQIADVHVIFSYIPRDIRFETLPKVPPNELESLIQHKIREEFSGENHQRIVRYQVLETLEERGVEKLRVLIISVRESDLSQRLAMLERAGVKPTLITIPSLAMWQGYQTFQNSQDKEGGTFIMDIGRRRTIMMFFHNGLLHFIREMSIGGDSFTQELTGDYGDEDSRITLNREQAEKLKQEFGIPLRENDLKAGQGVTYRQLAVKGRPALEKFLDQINRSIDYFRSELSDVVLRQVYMIGGGALLLHLEELLSNTLGMPVRPMPVFQRVTIGMEITDSDQLARDALRLVPALGAAMAPEDGLNLLVVDVAEQRRNRLAWLGWAASACLVIALMTLFSVSQYETRQAMETSLAGMQQQAQSVQALRQQVQRLQQEKTILLRFQQLMETELPGLSVQHPTVDMLRQISQVVPNYIRLDNIDFNPGADGGPLVRLQGRLRESVVGEELVYQFLIHLEQSGLFRKVSLSSVQAGEDGNGESFVIECLIATGGR
jgi:type IV pilus assembly protein PilM